MRIEMSALLAVRRPPLYQRRERTSGYSDNVVPRRNIALSLFFATLVVIWAIWQHTYAALVLLVPLLAIPFFLSRARRP